MGLVVAFITLVALFSVLSAESPLAVSRPLSHRILQSAVNSSAVCADAIASGLVDQNATCRNVTDASVLQHQLMQLVQAYLSDDPRCASNQVPNITWMQYPAWVTSVLSDWIEDFRVDPSTAAYFSQFVSKPVQLPPPSQLKTTDAMRDYESMSNYTMGTTDMSGYSPSSLMNRKEFAAYQENTCIDRVTPKGPVHPRAFLLLFYRADVLAKLYGEEEIVSAAPPDDWEAFVELLKAYDSIVRQATPSSSSTSTAAANSLPSYGICITMQPTCGRVGDVLAAIAASVLQTNGTKQGYVYDLSYPPSMVPPLVNGTAWRYAMGVLRRLLQYNAHVYSPSKEETCVSISPSFLEGDCLMTLEWDVTFTRMLGPTPLSLPGVLRVAPLPGSRQVMSPNATTSSTATLNSVSSTNAVNGSSNSSSSTDGTSDSSSSYGSSSSGGALLQCGSPLELCTVSGNHDVLYLTSVGQSSAVVAAARLNQSACSTENAIRVEAAAITVADRGAVAHAGLVNRAPYSVLFDYNNVVKYEQFTEVSLGNQLLLQSIRSRMTKERSMRQQALDELRLASGAAAAAKVSDSASGSDSNGKSVWNTMNFSSMPWWVGIAGDGVAIPAAAMKVLNANDLDTGAVQSYLQALWHAVNSPNLATDIPSPPTTINWHKWALSHASLLLQPPQSDVDEAANQLLRLFQLATEMYTASAVRTAYEAAVGADKWRPTGFGDNRPPPDAAALGSSDEGMPKGMLAAIVVGSVTGVVLPALVVVLLMRRMRDRNRNLLGRVTAPRAGPDTTLLISDVQNSTVLWEQLPEEVMDLALKLHHSTFRTLLPRYDGYESGTEGDSFILAFADPATAVDFASACQVELLLQEWPHELLQQPDAEVVLIDLRDGDAATLAGDARRFCGRASSGTVATSSIFSALKAQFQRHSPPASSLRGTAISPQPSESQLPPLLPPLLTGMPFPHSTFDTSADVSTYGISLFGRRRSMDLGLPLRGPYVSSSGPSVAAMAMAMVATTGSILGRRRSASGDVDMSMSKQIGLRMSSAGNISSNPRDIASLDSTTSGAYDFAPLSSGSGSGGAGIGKLLGARLGDRGTGGLLGGFVPALPTLREGPTTPWVTMPSVQWSAALQAAFPQLPPHDMPAVVMGDMSLRVPLVSLPCGRTALVAYRGLRVRMGLHTGLDDPQHIAFNKVDSAIKYQGPFAETARCTIDAAPGGMVVLSGRAFARLRHCINAAAVAAGPTGKLGARRAPEALVLYAGHHVLRTPLPRPQPAEATSLSPGGTSGGSIDTSSRDAKAVDGAGGRGAPVVRFKADGFEAACGEQCTADNDTTEGTALYQAVPPALACRLALCSSLVSKRVVQLSSLGAPIGCVTVAFMYVVGASTLLSELPGPAKRALEQFQELVCRLLGSREGYLVEGGDGLVLAAFGSPSSAVEWALDSVDGLKKLDWESELLGHWLCEEVLSVGLARSGAMSRRKEGEASVRRLRRDADSFSTINGDGDDNPDCNRHDGDKAEGGSSSRGLSRRSLGPSLSRLPSMAKLGSVATTRRILERGLRIKVGLETGMATHSLNEASGRLGYRGKVMNRASRVAGKAAAGQVLCTDVCWQACLAAAGNSSRMGATSGEEGEEGGSGRTGGSGSGDDQDGMASEYEMGFGGLVGISLGKVALKGVTPQVELIQCMRG